MTREEFDTYEYLEVFREDIAPETPDEGGWVLHTMTPDEIRYYGVYREKLWRRKKLKREQE